MRISKKPKLTKEFELGAPSLSMFIRTLLIVSSSTPITKLRGKVQPRLSADTHESAAVTIGTWFVGKSSGVPRVTGYPDTLTVPPPPPKTSTECTITESIPYGILKSVPNTALPKGAR